MVFSCEISRKDKSDSYVSHHELTVLANPASGLRQDRSPGYLCQISLSWHIQILVTYLYYDSHCHFLDEGTDQNGLPGN
jgi:hypothetical protein